MSKYQVTKVTILPNVTLSLALFGGKAPSGKIYRVEVTEVATGRKMKTDYVRNDRGLCQRYADDYKDPLNPTLVPSLCREKEVIDQMVEIVSSGKAETLTL